MKLVALVALVAAAMALSAHATSSARRSGCAWGALAWKHGCLVDGHSLSARTGDLRKFGLGVFPAWGAGPAWPAFDPPQQTLDEPFEFGPQPEYADWGVRKVMWAVDPRYAGPVLVRGRQLDGPNEIRFENGSPGFTDEQRLHPPAELRLVGGDVHPAATRVRAVGCYGYQLDGIGFSPVIVFRAVAV